MRGCISERVVLHCLGQRGTSPKTLDKADEAESIESLKGKMEELKLEIKSIEDQIDLEPKEKEERIGFLNRRIERIVNLVKKKSEENQAGK